MPSSPSSQRASISRRARRRGAALIEFAVCLPILALLVFGTIEATSYVFLKQSLQVAAHEGALAASRPLGTTAQAQQAAEAILQSREVHDSQVRFPESDVGQIARGQPVSIEVHANSRANSPLVGQFIPNRHLMARVTMIKE
jgi:hypothetical protein